jgi:hypothetical protein
MTRALSIAFWLVSAAAAIASAVLFGYLGWAAILFWTVLVLPCTLYQRRRMNGHWPSATMLRLWAIAIGLNVLGGIVPPLFSTLTLPDGVGTVVAWILVTIIWSGVVASVMLLLWITGTAIRLAGGQQARAA